MRMPGAALDVRGLCAGYGPTRVVDDVTFALSTGERVALLGRNGVGKTTLLASLMGLVTHHAGDIALGDVDVTRRAASARAALGLGLVPQTRDIFRSLTVEENLIAGLKARPRAALAEAYALFPRLAERRHHLGLQLSGGEQQMLSMARTLLGVPAVLLLDEPLEGLAPVVCDRLMASLTDFAAARGLAVLLVEQQVERALDFAERILVMERGRLVWRGTPAALRDDRAAIERLLGIEGVGPPARGGTST
jgi:branched-chain amino acid transport system ATP-binding protein